MSDPARAGATMGVVCSDLIELSELIDGLVANQCLADKQHKIRLIQPNKLGTQQQGMGATSKYRTKEKKARRRTKKQEEEKARRRRKQEEEEGKKKKRGRKDMYWGGGAKNLGERAHERLVVLHATGRVDQHHVKLL